MDKPNTEVRYTYRDYDNFKADGRVVLAGTLSVAETETILNALDGDRFIPGQVGLGDLRGEIGAYRPHDGLWHELNTICPTAEDPTVDMTAAEFAGRFGVKWDDEDPTVAVITDARLRNSVAKLAEMLGGLTGFGVAGHFACHEATDIAELLKLAGHPESAGHFLTHHAANDGGEDSEAHRALIGPDGRPDQDALREYVETL